MEEELLRLSAFAVGGRGGNPAGVWLGDRLPEVERMQQLAAEVGYSETAFNARVSDRRWTTRYYSPRAEVSFCGHATIATGVALGARLGPGTLRLDTAVGEVVVAVTTVSDGSLRASLTSVQPESRPLPDDLLSTVLDSFGWSRAELDPAVPPGLSYAGAWHLIVPVASRSRLAGLHYDVDRLLPVMVEHGLTTVAVVQRESGNVFHARNPFPVGGVVEDPATGAAAAALGAHLREHGLVRPPAAVTIHQGYDMGQPSDLHVEVPVAGGVSVSGGAVPVVDEPVPVPGGQASGRRR